MQFIFEFKFIVWFEEVSNQFKSFRYFNIASLKIENKTELWWLRNDINLKLLQEQKTSQRTHRPSSF